MSSSRQQQATIRPGKRAGYTEIVFPAKPPPAVRDRLMAAGYRWSSRYKVWYGRTPDLPKIGDF